MSRDQQDGHGFGVCVKAGKDPGQYMVISQCIFSYNPQKTLLVPINVFKNFGDIKILYF